MIKPNNMNLSSICFSITGSIICWTALYFALVRTKLLNQTPEFYGRIVTVIHGFVAVILSAGCYWQGPDPFQRPGESNTLLQDITLVVSLGYFWYDLTWCIYYQTEPVIMLWHHLASVVSIGMVLFGRASGGEAVAGILSLELTNPLLQLRWFLRTAGLNRTVIHTLVELTFVVSFVFMRLGIGTYLTYCVIISRKPKKGVKLCTFSHYLISLAFIYYIFKFIKRKYTNSKEKSSD